MTELGQAGAWKEGLPGLIQVLDRHRRALASECAQLATGASDLPSLRALGESQLDGQIERLAQALRLAAASSWDPCDDLLRQLGRFAARSGEGLRRWCDRACAWAALLSRRLIAEQAGSPAALDASLRALQTLLARLSASLAECHTEARLGEVPLASDPRFLRLFESGIICVIICDLIGNIKDANDAFLSMVGYSREDLISGQVRWVDMTPAEWRHLDDDAVEQLKARGVTRSWEKEYIRKDGTRVPILVGVAMLNETECVAFVVDITERKRLEQLRGRALELETQNRRIREANRLKGEFLANMSHELRTPLNSIIGFAELMYDGEVSPDSPKHHEYLGDIVKSSRHLLQIINDVLDLAKIEAGKIELRPETVDVGQIAAETSAILRTGAAAKNIKLQLDIDPSLGQVVVDPGRLKQVIYNYASNALKFTPEGGQIIIRARPQGEREFRLEVQDNGIGISPNDRSQLFVEFQQLDAGTAKRHQGTGLGLALTKRLVEAQGGTVGVESVAGKGSIFHAVLPFQALAASPEPEETGLDGSDEPGPVILVVEDDPRDRRLLVQILRQAKYGTEAVASGLEALAACQERAFDAITLDLLLPDLTGLEVLHSLRQEGRNLDTPVLVVSVVADRGIVGGYSVHDFLSKPIESAELLASLARARVVPDQGQIILVVDDDPGALKIMEATLSRLGYRAECRSDAPAALAYLDRHRPAAVILDLLMPRMDGFEFLARFRQQPQNQDIPAIVWTMKDLTSEDLNRLRRLAQAVVTKGNGQAPHLIEQLRRLLRPEASRPEAHP